MKYRELDIADLPKLQRDINQAVFWQQYVEFARRFYNDTVVKLECETYGEYNDEGGTDYRVNEVTAYDYNGEEVPPDMSIARPFIIANRRANEYWTKKRAADIEDVSEYNLEDSFSEERYNLPIADQDEYHFTVDLTKQPVRPRIAIIEDD